MKRFSILGCLALLSVYTVQAFLSAWFVFAVIFVAVMAALSISWLVGHVIITAVRLFSRPTIIKVEMIQPPEIIELNLSEYFIGQEEA